MNDERSTNVIQHGRSRVVIANVSPEIDGGRYPIKRVAGETVGVEADLFADGHDVLSAVLRFRRANDTTWTETPMELIGNDRWRASFTVTELGAYLYSVEGWVDHFKSWRHDLTKRIKAGQDVSVELLAGANLIEEAATRAKGEEASLLHAWAKEIGAGDKASLPQRTRRALDEPMAVIMSRHPDRRFSTRLEREWRVTVDPVLARYGAWYEIFPRSCPGKADAHGTLKDCEAHLSRGARMGFDVLYFPPIHPIGQAFRKGRNNRTACQPGEPGSPWGIGGADGGHTAIHAELGTLEDFRRLVTKARAMKIEIALDIAFQCSPDHPWVCQHPEWFKKRPDGTIQYAENPPKKYQDIFPINFESEDWRGLWQALKGVIDFWIEQGVTVFRVDNPHTKAMPFWEWMIGEVKAAHPEIIFLSEAFTRPKVMYHLAKLGFTQSYNYFPWRNTKDELTEYFEDLARTKVREFFRPNLWPNTPDILTQYLQYGGRPAFMARLILAATLGASYGIYGPAYEMCDNAPREIGSEEYLNSEKYEIKQWDLAALQSLEDLISRVNRIRRENPALHTDERITFHPVDNDQIIAYSKATEDLQNVILTVVNLDPHHVQSGWLSLALDELGAEPKTPYQVHDLLTGERYLWHDRRNFVQLDPKFVPAAIFRLRRRIRTERDFDYFL